MPEAISPSAHKVCFVVGPIGEDGSPIRNNADMLYEFVIRPALEPLGYELVRADKISIPGMISEQIINRVFDADLVVADLTSHNANAFYELALRHAAGRPAIHMITQGERIPFDVTDSRAIAYSLVNPTAITAALDLLRSHAAAVEQPGFKVSDPVTRARGVQTLAASEDAPDKLLLNLMDQMALMVDRLGQTEARLNLAEANLVWQTGGLPLGDPAEASAKTKRYRSLAETIAAYMTNSLQPTPPLHAPPTAQVSQAANE